MSGQPGRRAATPGPRVVVGMPVYEPGIALDHALNGLLSQSYADVRLLVVDDASTDPVTLGVLDGVARRPGVTVVRNPSRLGLSANWQATFRMARQRFPGAEFFAWAGHHDDWEEGWLAALVERLDANPGAVLACPLDARSELDGTPNDRGTGGFSTVDERDPGRRVAACASRACAGSAVYGLVRVSALERTGGFDRVLLPDRLVVAKLALLGEFELVPRVLWRRRMTAATTVRRQRAAIFPEGAPAWTFLPPAVTHGPGLARWAARAGVLGPIAAIRVAIGYTARALARDARQLALDGLFKLEGRLPSGLTASARRAVGLQARRW